METFIIIILLSFLFGIPFASLAKKMGIAYYAAARYAPTVELRREYSRKISAGRQ